MNWLNSIDYQNVDGVNEPTAFSINANPPTVTGNGSGRVIPDVSTDADPESGYLEYSPSFADSDGPGPVLEGGWGGTSFVSPQLAGSAAVIDSSLGRRTGLWNPAMYRAATANHSPFTPLDTSGTSNDNIYYTGTPGTEYNPGAGLGTPNLNKAGRRPLGGCTRPRWSVGTTGGPASRGPAHRSATYANICSMRWERQLVEAEGGAKLPGYRDATVRHFDAPEAIDTRFYEVQAKSILNRVPEASQVPFRWTINPYRGCSHACAYCFARPTHEYLGLDAGRDFEREIVVKVNAPELLRAELKRVKWQGEHVALGTNTDPYQWVEGRYELMRGIWAALRDARNPCSVLTKSPLLLRDPGPDARAQRGDRLQRRAVDPHARTEGVAGH